MSEQFVPDLLYKLKWCMLRQEDRDEAFEEIFTLRQRIAAAEAALLCKTCNGRGEFHHAVSDTWLQCVDCSAWKIREAAKGGRDELNS